MSPLAALLPELEQAIQRGSTQKRADMAERITDLFIEAANHFDPQQIALFDQILGRLIEEIEQRTLARISARIAPFERAPIRVVQRLAGNDDIEVAAPMLRRSPRLADRDLAAIARHRGTPHLLAISERPTIAAPVTDILVVRGDRAVLHAVATNRGAAFSKAGLETLVKRAAGDDQLTETVALRPDIPIGHLRELVRQATEIVRQRLLAVAADQGARQEISAAIAEVSNTVGASVSQAYRNAQRKVLALLRQGQLDELLLRNAAGNGDFEETVAMLSALSHVSIETVEQLVRAERPDGLLILARALGIEWPTLHAIMVLRRGRAPGPSLKEAKLNFERLSHATAERVVSFWRGSKPRRTFASADIPGR